MRNDLETVEREFLKYWQQLTDDSAPQTSFAIDDSVSRSGKDAYSVSESNGTLVFRANNLRSLFYAIYDFYRRKGCRWYWDHDSLPPKRHLDIRGTAFREESRFEYRGIRYFAHRGLTRFQAEHWGPDDWKKEIDWCLKNRLNLFMPRIGMDDTWQKAYPDIVPYPNPEERLPEAQPGFNDRSLFWSLEYRGKLRKLFTDYAFSRGMMMPTDFGTMTHWYSRTPRAYLEKRKPELLPQTTSGYSEDTGRVFDIRKPGYIDEYWRLSEAFMKAGYGKPDLMHTIGLGERMVYSDRSENLKLKISVIKVLCAKVAKEYPDSKVLLAGWDFYFTWKPEEVRALLPELDPNQAVIWDYEADARSNDHDWIAGGRRDNDFTQWNVVKTFPYVFGIFLCYESGIDIRADYELIARRQKAIADDEMCKGYILWPESSHTDILAIEYFTQNCWDATSGTVPAILHDLCVHRYGSDAVTMEKAWDLLIPVSSLSGWGDNCVQKLTCWLAKYTDEPYWFPVYSKLAGKIGAVEHIYETLRHVNWANEAVYRDSIDIARTSCDRLNSFLRERMLRAFDAWTREECDAQTVEKISRDYEREANRLADILSLHTDYSIYESLMRLDAIEKIRYRDFSKTLVENATNSYCRSHEYEMVKHWYVPFVERIAGEARRRISADERKSLKGDPMLVEWNKELGVALRSAPLESLCPTSPRTLEAFLAALA